jgi:Cd2+/Zn2+-exporting ATPase
MPNLDLKIEGMDCAEEVAVLRQEIGPVVGGAEKLAFDLLRGKMTVLNNSASAADIMSAVRRTGMKAELWTEAPKPGTATAVASPFRTKYARSTMTAISGVFTAAGLLQHALSVGSISGALGSEGLGLDHAVPMPARVLYAIAIIAGGWYVAPKAVFAVRRLRPDMNLLMTVAVIGAVIIGEWLEAALVSFLFALSLALESWSVGRARHAVEALLDLAPPTARLLVNGRETETPAEDVAIGSVFLVKPGDRIPLDGEVVRGMSEVNQAPITGESVPAPKEPGAQVFAGTINGNGALEVRSTKAAAQTVPPDRPPDGWLARRWESLDISMSLLNGAMQRPVVFGRGNRIYVRAMLHQNFDDFGKAFITSLHDGTPVAGRLRCSSEQNLRAVNISGSGHTY